MHRSISPLPVKPGFLFSTAILPGSRYGNPARLSNYLFALHAVL
jgi:hypothetical protein